MSYQQENIVGYFWHALYVGTLNTLQCLELEFVQILSVLLIISQYTC